MAQQELSRNVQNDNNNTEYNTNIPSIVVSHITRPPPPPCPTINLSPGHPTNIINDQGAPPSNEEVIDRNAPPPSYDSLFGRMIEAQKVSKRTYDFAFYIQIRHLCFMRCTLITSIVITVSLSMMIIGGMYLYDCPQSEYIPLYLLVAGGFEMYTIVLKYCFLSTCLSAEEGDEERIQKSSGMIFIDCSLTVWFIIGSMWVYEVYEPNYDPALGEYCNKTLYLFAFWLTTIIYILLGIRIVLHCFVAVLTIILKKRRMNRLMSM